MLKPHKLIIDRITKTTAHLETADEQQIIIPTTWLPQSAREGDILDATHEESGGARSITLTTNHPATQARREQLKSLHDALPRGPEGDIDL